MINDLRTIPKENRALIAKVGELVSIPGLSIGLPEEEAANIAIHVLALIAPKALTREALDLVR